MALNRYRLRHQVRKGVKAAKRVFKLLESPEELLSVILIGNTLAMVIASSLFTLMAEELFGHLGILLAPIILTLLMLIFAEITPKTIAAIHPERVAYAVSLPLRFFYWLFFPLMRLLSLITLSILRLFRISLKSSHDQPLTNDELRVLVSSHPGQARPHREMLEGILELEHVSVDDIMIPRSDISGVNLDQPWKSVLKSLQHAQHQKLVIYRGSVDQPYGMLDTRVLTNLLIDNALNRTTLLKSLDQMHYIPEGTPLSTQLRRFQAQRYRKGLVIDEHGMVIGLVSLQDILEEIVGDFNDEANLPNHAIETLDDGSIIVPGTTAIRDINRELDLELPIQGPNTLGGLIVEQLESLPQSGLCLRIGGYPVEILRVENNTICSAKLMPQYHAPANDPAAHHEDDAS